MLQKLLTTVGRVYSFLMSLIGAAILGVVTWAFWGVYQDEQVQNQFMREGQLMSVTVNRAEQQQRSWQDWLSNSTYLTVQYRGKAYISRFVMDTAYVSEGDRVQLLYHPAFDAFRQARNWFHPKQDTRTSRLIQWTTIRVFSDENKLLLLCLILSTASFFLITGVIVTIIPIGFLRNIARLVFMVELVMAAMFFTYDTYQYFQYYQHLKTNGREVAVQVLDTDRRSYGRNSHRHGLGGHWYSYEATIHYQQQERVIPISEDDFERLKPTDTLQAYYDESVNDFMSVDFPPDYWQVILPAFFWFVSILLIRSAFGRRQQKQPTSAVK